MNFYRQAIALFGIVLPVIIGIAVVAAGYLMHSKMNTSFDDKKRTFSEHRTNTMQVDMIEETVKADRIHLERWEEQLARETASEVGTNLKEITDSLPNKEIQLTSLDPSGKAGGFGAASAQGASQVRMGFRGTFRTLQKTFLELETRMPQLQLEELTIKPVSTSGYLLTMQVTYTAWHK